MIINGNNTKRIEQLLLHSFDMFKVSIIVEMLNCDIQISLMIDGVPLLHLLLSAILSSLVTLLVAQRFH